MYDIVLCNICLGTIYFYSPGINGVISTTVLYLISINLLACASPGVIQIYSCTMIIGNIA